MSIRTFTAQIVLIIFTVLYLVSLIIGTSVQAQDVFAIVIFYLRDLFSLVLLITILIGNIMLIRLRKIGD